jgi:uncharacterized protein (TIGR00369 family)
LAFAIYGMGLGRHPLEAQVPRPWEPSRLAVVTSEYKINYVKPAIGETLIARATVIAAGRRQAVCRCDVFVVNNGSEALCATAQGTIVSMEIASVGTG